MISFSVKTKKNKYNSWMEKCLNLIKRGKLNEYGQIGVEMLKNETPVDTGQLSNSWYYKVKHEKHSASITWHNDDIENGVSVALILQFGHATSDGLYYQGIDYVNPVMDKVLDKVTEDLRKEMI